MRFVQAALLLAVSASPALAQREPEIVIPGKPGVPIYINGIDASWAVVEGEFGLDRPGAMTPVITYRPILLPIPYRVPGYYPSSGKTPGYGRLEIVPPANRTLPPPAPAYYRSWSSESAPGPVTEYPPYEAAPVYVAPRYGRRRGPSSAHNTNPNSPTPYKPDPNKPNQDGPGSEGPGSHGPGSHDPGSHEPGSHEPNSNGPNSNGPNQKHRSP